MGSDDRIGRRQAAQLLDVHPDTVSKMLHDGLDHALIGRKGRGGKLWFSRRAVLCFAAGRGGTGDLDPKVERARKDRAQAALSEQKLAQQAGDLIPRHEVERMIAAELGAVRTVIVGLPSLTSDRLYRAGQRNGRAGHRAEYEAAVREVLEQLADQDRPIDCPACGADISPSAAGQYDEICGAPTASGAPCQNPPGEDGRCHIQAHKMAA